jgi:hypothetical protein
MGEEKSPGTPLKNNVRRKVDIECGFVTANKIFKSKQSFIQAFEMMPKEYK